MPKKINVIRKRVASLCEAEPAITAAYIFGSYAQRKGEKTSDVNMNLDFKSDPVRKLFPMPTGVQEK
jgi:predicted nucleotidyltransferase